MRPVYPERAGLQLLEASKGQRRPVDLLLTFCFSLAAFTQGAVVGGGEARRNNVSFLPFPFLSFSLPSFAYKVRRRRRRRRRSAGSLPRRFLADAVRHFDCAGTERQAR